MKFKAHDLALVPAVLLFAPACSATDSAAPVHLSQALHHSAAASGQAVAASGEVGVSVAKTALGAAGVALSAAGGVVGASGALVKEGGEAVGEGGKKLWDFASGDPSERPTADRQRSVPPAKSTVRADPAPAEVLKPGAR